MSLAKDNEDYPCADPRVLSILESSFNTLKSNGGDIRAGSDELWINPSNLLDYSADDVGGRLQEIKVLTRTAQALLALTTNLITTIVNRQKILLHRGLALLPYEVFLRIFKHLLHSEEESKRFRLAMDIIAVMSLVCRHFRQIVLAFTEVWSYIDLNLLENEAIELFLLRSKKEPLSVSFRFCEEIEEDLLRLLEYKDRWIYLSAEFAYQGDILEQKYPRIDFPSVRAVCLDIGPDEIFRHWSFPCAEYVELFNWLPDDDSPIFNRDIVKTIKYDSDTDKFDDEDNFLMYLSLFLYPPIAVQTLDLDVSNIHCATNRGESPPVHLPGVTTLRITNCRSLSGYNRDDPMPLDAFEEITALLELPNAQNVSVSVAFTEQTFDLAEFLDNAFPPENGLRSVGEMTFNIMWLRNSRKSPPLSLPLDAFFQRFPALQVLSLDAPLCGIRCSESNDIPMKKFRAFHLKHYDDHLHILYRALGVLRSRGVALQEFTLVTKDIPNQTALRKAIPNGTIRTRRLPITL